MASWNFQAGIPLPYTAWPQQQSETREKEFTISSYLHPSWFYSQYHLGHTTKFGGQLGMSPEPVDPISSSEVEISGFFNSSVLSHDVFLDAVLWERMWCFAENRHLRVHMMVRKNMSEAHKQWEDPLALCLSLLVFTGFCLSLLVFIGLHFVEKNVPKYLSWYPDLCQFTGD